MSDIVEPLVCGLRNQVKLKIELELWRLLVLLEPKGAFSDGDSIVADCGMRDRDGTEGCCYWNQQKLKIEVELWRLLVLLEPKGVSQTETV